MNRIIKFCCALFGGFLLAGCSQEAGTVKEASEPLFTLLKPGETGIDFQNKLSEGLNTNILMYEYFYNGGGVAAGDFNNDGLVDLYFTSNMSDNKLYLNKGAWKFQDITSMCGASGRPGPWKTGVNVVDINGDGKLDIYLCYSGAMPPEKRANQLFINTGNSSSGIPHFEEQAAAYGLASTAFSNQSYFFDYDRDGDLDMLLLNHNPKNLPIQNVEATRQLFHQDNPEKGLRLFKQTNGKFEDATLTSGINGSELSYGLSIGISDFNDDGWPDFYVSNDYSVPDFLYLNNKNGTFTNDVEKCIGHTSQFSMGNDVADINNDGFTDIFTLDMLPEDNRRQKLLLSPDNYSKFDLNVRSGFYYQYMRNMLQLNNGNGTFSEVGQQEGVSNTDWSWAALLADYDNDGWKDLFVSNGYYRDFTNLDFLFYMNNYVEQQGKLSRENVMDIVKQMPSSNVINYGFRNDKGKGFQNATEAWGLAQPSNSNGAAYADLDNDGDLDLVVNNINQPAFVYENNARQHSANHFLQISLTGTGGNTQGLGSRIRLFSGGEEQVQEESPTRGYLSSVSSVLHFGLGGRDKIDSLIVTWNSGREQRLYNLKIDTLLRLNENEATEKASTPKMPTPLFALVAAPFSFKDSTSDVHDYDRQALLVCELSHNSPCMTQADINGDGLEDVLIGGGNGQATKIYLQEKVGSFKQLAVAAFEKDKAYTDAAIAVFDANGDKQPDIYVASGGYGSLQANDTLLQDRLYINTGKNSFVRSAGLANIVGSKSSVCINDVNGDGAPDIFVGGRVVPGRYPETPRSYLLINDGKGSFTDQTAKICPALVKPGMVTDAAWIDLNKDGRDELVVVGEWMPVMIFKNTNSKLVNATRDFLDSNYAGWWNKIGTGDFNNDGHPDLIIGNMGRNTQFQPMASEPLEMYYKDFDNNGSVDPVFSFYIQHKRYPYLTRDELLMQLPAMRKRFPDFKSYADVTLDQLFDANQLKDAGHLIADHMNTTFFLSNPQGKLKETPLPPEVQYSPVHTIETLDYNNDGAADLLLCGNNSRFKIRLGKFDANYGLLLQGDGKGNFRYVPQTESGFALRGDVRSALFINNIFYFGVNGKPLLAYKQNRIKNDPPAFAHK